MNILLSKPNFVCLFFLCIHYDLFIIIIKNRHQWDTVVQAVWRKYPNPLNPSVIGIDILDRSVCPQTSVMRTHRLIGCKWGLPGWAESLLGRSKTYASEYSEIDPRAKNFTLRSKNVSHFFLE